MLTLMILAALAGAPDHALTLAPGESIGAWDEGTGPAVVLVPGLTGCAYGFRRVVPPLAAAGCRVVVIEPLGIGGSSRPPTADYTLTAQADRIAAALDSLQTGAAVLVGHGMSGSIVLRLAVRRPDLAAHVVLLEGAPAESALTPGVAASLKAAGLAVRMGGTRLLRDRFEAGLRAASADDRWVDGMAVRRYFAGTARDPEGTIAALKVMAAAREPQALAGALARITCPVTLVLGGAPHDGAPTPDDLAALRALAGRLEELVVPDCGHFLQEEKPADVAAVILAAVRPQTALMDGAREGSMP